MRPEILFPLFQDVTALPGIGPRLATLVAKVAGPRVKDVAFLKPTGLVDRSRRVSVADAPEDEIVTLTGTVEEHIPGRRQGQPYKVRLFDETGFLHLVYFHGRPDYLQRVLPVGEKRIVSGRCERYGSEIQMLHPDLVMTEEEAAQTKAAETKAIADDAQRDLDEAMPAYYASVDALKSLNKADIQEVKAYKQPPELVVMTLELEDGNALRREAPPPGATARNNSKAKSHFPVAESRPRNLDRSGSTQRRVPLGQVGQVPEPVKRQ